MIYILFVAKNNDFIQKYYVDKLGRFLVETDNKKNEIILENVSNKVDMAYCCDNIMHFVLQDKEGSLIYLNYDAKTWKKYKLFNCIHKEEKIYDLKLCVIDNILCAFYILETNNEMILVKHLFTSSDITKIPEVIDKCDKSFEISLCTLENYQTHLFYKNTNGEIIEKVFNQNFSLISDNKAQINGDIQKLVCISCKDKIYMLFIEQTKSYNVLKFKTENTEKIICFALGKNAPFGIMADYQDIKIRWVDNFNLYEVKSSDKGLSFTKPLVKKDRYYACQLREKGFLNGMFCNNYIITQNDDFLKKTIKNLILKENKNMEEYKKYSFSSDESFMDTSKDKYIKNLISIENEINNLRKDTQKICNFLERLIEFKNDAKTPKKIKLHTFSDNTHGEITDTNEENIKLFNEMNIDDVLPNDIN